MLVTPLVLIQIFSKRMQVDRPKCGSDPRDEGHLACLVLSTTHSQWKWLNYLRPRTTCKVKKQLTQFVDASQATKADYGCMGSFPPPQFVG